MKSRFVGLTLQTDKERNTLAHVATLALATPQYPAWGVRQTDGCIRG